MAFPAVDFIGCCGLGCCMAEYPFLYGGLYFCHAGNPAAIDGAGPWQRFRRITFPLLLPASGVVLTSTSISAVNVFDEIVSLAGYGDLGKTLLIQDYLTTFSFLDFGTGSALSYLIMILAGLLGLLYLKSIAREGEEL